MEVALLAFLGTTAITYFSSLSQKEQDSLFSPWGVRLEKLVRATQEIERKTFHLPGWACL